MVRRAVARVWMLLPVLTGCGDRPLETNFHLGMVAYSPAHELLIVGSPDSRAIDLFRVPSDGLDGTPLFVNRLNDPHRNQPIRIAVDRKRGWLWVLELRAVVAYELSGLSQVVRVELPSDNYYEMFSDVLVDTTGDVYLLARGGARIYQIASWRNEPLAMTLWLDVAPHGYGTAIALTNQLLKTGDGRYLLTVSPTGEPLLRIDLASKRITPVRLSQPVAFTCGIPFWNEQGPADGFKMMPPRSSITMFDCFGRWEARIRLADEHLVGAVQMTGENIRLRPPR